MKRRVLFLLLCFVVTAVFAAPRDEVSINIQSVSNAPYNTFLASFIDPANASTQPIIFTGLVSNQTSAQIGYQVVASLKWNDKYLFNAKEFPAINPLPAGGSLSFTSRDLITQSGILFTGSISFDEITQNCPEFEDALMATGHYPDGVYSVKYHLNWWYTAHPGQTYTTTDVTNTVMTIVNPSPISLVYPGTALGNTPVSVSDPNPVFIWSGNVSSYHYYLYVLDSASQTADAIEQLTPEWETTTNTTMLSYGGPAMEAGKIYAWKIKGELNIPGGSSPEISTGFFVFTLSNSSATTAEDPLTTLVRNFLQARNEDGATQGVSLINGGYQASEITFNGQPFSMAELIQIIGRINRGETTVTGITVE